MAFRVSPNVVWKKIGPVTLALGMALGLSATASAQTVPAHVNDANQLVLDLEVSGLNEYGSSPSFIVWAGAQSQARVVCATFVTELLKHTYGWTTTTFKTWMGSTSPNASKYHDAIEAQNGFTRITRIADVLPGDLLAIEYADGTSSGHVALIVSAPALRSESAPLVAGTSQYDVMVVDSSSSYHGWEDTRVNQDKTWSNGVGRGTMRLYTDAAGTIVGYTWSTKTGSDYYDLSSARHLVVGRLQ